MQTLTRRRGSDCDCNDSLAALKKKANTATVTVIGLVDHLGIISDGLRLKMANTEQAVCDAPQCKLIAKTSEMATETDDSGHDWDDSGSEEESENRDIDCNGISEEEMDHSRIISDGLSLKMATTEQTDCYPPPYKPIAKTTEMVTKTDESGWDWNERIISDCKGLELSSEEQAVCDPPQCKLIAKKSEMVTETDDSGSDWDDSSSEEESENRDSDCNGISEEDIDHSRIICDGLSLKIANTEQAVCKPIAKTLEMVTETDDVRSTEAESEYSGSDSKRISEEEMDYSLIISDCNTEQAVDDPLEYKLSTKVSVMVGTAEARKGSESASSDCSIKTKDASGTGTPSSQLMQHQYLEELMTKKQRSFDRPSFIQRLGRILCTNPACDTSVDITVAIEIPADDFGKVFGRRDDFVRRCGDKPEMSQEDHLLEVVSVQKRPWNRFY